jgi:hypothetical protein
MHESLPSTTLGRLGLILLLGVGATACDTPDESGVIDTASPPASTDPVVTDVAAAPSDPPALAPAPARMVSSPDGLVTLDLPAGAVATGTEVTIEPVEPGEGELSAYSLLPDGLELASDAHLTIQVDNDLLGSGDQTTRTVVLTADEATTAEVIADPTLATFTASIGTLQRVGVGGSLEVDGRQIEPAASTPVGDGFVADFEFSTVDGEPVAVRDGQWYPFDDGLGPLEGRCETAGPFERRALFAIEQIDPSLDAEHLSLALVSVQTLCEEAVNVSALQLDPSPFGVPAYDGPMYVRTGVDEVVHIGWPTADVPAGGTIGFTAVADDGSLFAECLIERREGQHQGPRCTLYDNSGTQLDNVQLEEREVDDVTYIELPPAMFDLALQQIVFATLFFRPAEFAINRYEADGTQSQSLVDVDLLMSAMSV